MATWLIHVDGVGKIGTEIDADNESEARLAALYWHATDGNRPKKGEWKNRRCIYEDDTFSVSQI